MKKRWKILHAGVTLPEVLLSVVILGAAYTMIRAGLGVLRNFSQQQTLLNVQQSSQSAFHMLNKDVRNARSFLTVSGDTLSMTAFNFKLGYDVATSGIFEPANIGIITYRYVDAPPAPPHLLRTEDFPGVGVKTLTFLPNMLVPADSANYISTCIPMHAVPPYEEIQIVLRVSPPGWKNQPIVYRANARLSTAQ